MRVCGTCSSNDLTAPSDGWEYEKHIPFRCSDEEAEVIEAALRGVEQWGWDVRPLAEATKGRPLQTLGWYLLHSCKHVDQFSLDTTTLRSWLSLVEGNYTSTVYHNSSHAADVLASVHYMVSAGGNKYLSGIEQMALLLAAMVHDMGHDGFSNTFHKSAMTQRAIDHNDQVSSSHLPCDPRGWRTLRGCIRLYPLVRIRRCICERCLAFTSSRTLEFPLSSPARADASTRSFFPGPQSTGVNLNPKP